MSIESVMPLQKHHASFKYPLPQGALLDLTKPCARSLLCPAAPPTPAAWGWARQGMGWREVCTQLGRKVRVKEKMLTPFRLQGTCILRSTAAGSGVTKGKAETRGSWSMLQPDPSKADSSLIQASAALARGLELAERPQGWPGSLARSLGSWLSKWFFGAQLWGCIKLLWVGQEGH